MGPPAHLFAIAPDRFLAIMTIDCMPTLCQAVCGGFYAYYLIYLKCFMGKLKLREARQLT